MWNWVTTRAHLFFFNSKVIIYIKQFSKAGPLGWGFRECLSRFCSLLLSKRESESPRYTFPTAFPVFGAAPFFSWLSSLNWQRMNPAKVWTALCQFSELNWEVSDKCQSQHGCGLALGRLSREEEKRETSFSSRGMQGWFRWLVKPCNFTQ